jgi:antitoxin CptB
VIEIDNSELDKPLRAVVINPNELPDIEQLRWQCRRGMLELDYLFEYFLEHSYSTLAADLKIAFVTLLSYPDPLLQQWMTGSLKPEDEAMAQVVKLLQSSRL